jgi:hypothetical protein
MLKCTKAGLTGAHEPGAANAWTYRVFRKRVTAPLKAS